MIPSPNLDDRTWQDIVEEAKRLIPQYCPEWTNFNTADPGITLIELFAWMTEMTLYRLNKVPDKNYIAFLELMGVHLQPPQPARTLLQFKLSQAADNFVVPAGSAFSTVASGGSRPISFETDEDVTVVTSVITRCVSQVHDPHTQKTLVADHTEDLVVGVTRPVEPFSGVRAVDRYLYLGDSRLQNFGENAILTIRIETPEQWERPFKKLLEWEYWNGEMWRELTESVIEVDKKTIAFNGPPAISTAIVGDVENYWIRARLVEVPTSSNETMVDTIRAKLEVLGEGIVPDKALVNVESDLFLTRDLDKNFHPFDREPKIDTTFYVACESILSQQDALVRLEIQLSDPSVANPPNPAADLLLRWEYWSGKKWTLIGRTTAAGVPENEPGRFGLKDDTYAFTKSGVLEFVRPRNMEACKVYGDQSYWLRCRIEAGNYGVPGSYENVDDRWVWKDEHPLRPPMLKSITFKSSEEPRAFEKVLTFNDWTYSDMSAVAAQDSKPFQAFAPIPEESPAFYLGLSDPFPPQTCQIYFQLEDEGRGASFPSIDERERALAGRDGEGAEQSVVWEYWAGKHWQALLPRDYTGHLTHSGFLRFVGPKDFRKTKRFGDELFWIRARLEMGGYDVPPRIQSVLLNCVSASNITTFRDTILGSSQGTPNQVFRFNRGPVLRGQQIVIRERDEPGPTEMKAILAESGEDSVKLDPEHPGEYLVRWKEVDSFFESTSSSRHYVKDIVTGELRFGDGVHGMIPPKADRNIVSTFYQVGGGEDGNVAAGMITVSRQTYAYIEAVTNPFPATGGCDLETVDEVKLRGPHMLKSRNRAVTAEDFEWLSIEASNSVARVRALSSVEREGEVTVVVVPKVPRLPSGDIDLREKPIPSTELLRRVRRYLDDRRLLTTVVRVKKPRYVEMSVEVRIVRHAHGSSDRIKREIDKNLRRFLNPLVGGRDGRGWPFGRSVFKVDLYHVIEGVAGIDFVDSVRIIDAERKQECDQLRLRSDELVYLVNVDVAEIAHEKII